MKEFDYLLSSINNPDFTSGDFKNIGGMSLDNTQFLDKDYYKNRPSIRNNQNFLDNQGNFSEQKFDDFYNKVADSFRSFSTESAIDDYEYSIWDPARPDNAKVKDINFKIETINNPDHIKIGVSGINTVTLSDKSKRQLAQNSKIYDPATATYLNKSVNDISLFNNPFEYVKSLFDDPLVYATYDEDTVETDPLTGNKVKHYKGEYKLNEDGEYYTEKANGRNLRGKTVVSASDYLTDDNSLLHKADFMASDDLDKSKAGTVVKNLVSVLPIFIPYARTVYSGLLVARELSKTLPMAYGMISSLTGNKNPDSQLSNTIAAYGQKFTGSTSDYAQENTFTFENFGNLMSDVATQWGQQKLIAQTFSKLQGGAQNALLAATAKAQKSYVDTANKYLKEFHEGKLSLPQLNTYLGTQNPYAVNELILSGKWAETTLGKAALNKFMPVAEKAIANRNRLASNISLTYMALISNTDVYDSVLEKGGTPEEAAALAFGSTLGMYGVDRYLGLGEMFLEKDPAKRMYRQAARENAELYMSKRPSALNTNTRNGIIEAVQKGIDIGKKTVETFVDKYKYGTVGILGKAIGEGAEEATEELVTDFTKNLGELAGRMGYFSQTDYGAWENAFDRYVMSFLGGTAGGAMFGVSELWNNRHQINQQQKDIIQLLRNGNKNEILTELKTLKDRGDLGNTNLSYDTTTDQDGNKTYLTADKEHKSQAEVNFDGLTNIINQLDLILNGNQLNLTDDDLFDRMVQGEYRANSLSDYLKGENLKEVSYISKYQDDFNKLSSDIVNKESEIQELINGTTDPAKRGTDFQEKLNKLKEEKQYLLDQKNYLFGKGSLGYVEKTLFAMDPSVSGNFVSLNINQIAREITGKSLESLTQSERDTVQKIYNQQKESKKDDLDIAFKLYKQMEQYLTPELKNLRDTNFEAEFKELSRIREDVKKLKSFQEEDKLPTETDEEYNQLFEGTEEEKQKKQEKHRKAVREYNIQQQTKWLEEFTKKPITSTDFRYLISQIGYTKQELLKLFLDSTDNGKHWWELTTNGAISEQNKIKKLSNDLHEMILKSGIDNEEKLRSEIKQSINNTATSIINDLYVPLLQENPEIIDTLQYISDNDSVKEEYGIPEDYKFNPEVLTYRDLAIFLKYDTQANGYSDIINDDASILKPFFKEFKEQLEPFAKFYSDVTINPDVLTTIEGATTLDSNRRDSEINELSDKISNVYFKNFDEFIKNVKEHPSVRQLNAIESTTFIQNPVIPLLNKIASFRTSVNVEELLKSIYELYHAQENNADFQLSEEQIKQLQGVLKDFNMAIGFIQGASTTESTGTPIGHNTFINTFIRNHKDVFNDVDELTEINKDDANTVLQEILHYKNEINSWLKKNEINSGLRDVKFTKASEALTKTLNQFFSINRDSFKIGYIDLLDGYEDLTIKDNLSSTVALQQLLYKNFKQSGLTVEEVLDQLSDKIFTLTNQDSSQLDENLTYSDLTDYDKFQIITSSLAVDPVRFYKNLKNFLDSDESIAPIAIQEYVGKLAYAQKENPELINDALEWYKKKANLGYNIAYNTTVITGLGGSGKTFAAIRLNLQDGKSTWVTGPTQYQQANLKRSLPSSTEISKKDLLDLVLNGNKFEDTFTITSDKYPVLKDIKFNKIDNAPKNIVIDEATHFNSAEILLISKFCKENGINLFLLGDFHQNGSSYAQIGSIETNVILSWKTPNLYLSLRNGNQNKLKNQLSLLEIIDKITPQSLDVLGNTLYENLFKKLNFQYYLGDSFSGEMITDTISDDVLAKISKDSRIGYIGINDATYKKLQDSGFNVSDPLSPEEVQGQEFDYVIINKNWELNLEDNWYNNNIRIAKFVKDLYTMITRSSKGTILIDNNLTKYISSSETNFDGTFDSLSSSVKKFRDKRLPEIEETIKNNPEVKETEQQEEQSDSEKMLKQNEPEPEQTPEQENLPEIQEQEIDSQINPNVPIACYSNVSYSGINTSNDVWINDNNSTSDLGIFINPKETVEPKDKHDAVMKVLQFKDYFAWGIDNWNNMPIAIRRKFSEDAVKNAKFYIKIEDAENTNRLIGLTEGTGLSNDDRTYNGKIIKLIAKIQGLDGKEYSLSLAGLSRPETLRKNTSLIKAALKKRIEAGQDKDGKLQKEYDTYEDSISRYENTLNEWVKNNQEIELKNSPISNKFTSLRKLQSFYRLEDIDSGFSPYHANAPMQVESPVYILTGSEPNIKPTHVGKSVMFVSSNRLLSPSQLKNLYFDQLTDPTKPKQVRMVILGQVGVSFESLFDKNWKNLYNITRGNTKFTTPMRLLPFGFRMYKSMWNYRADLTRFLSRYEDFLKQNNLTDEEAESLCKLDNDTYIEMKNKLGDISEDVYRKNVNQDLKDKLQILWNFNDDIGSYVKEFRLGFSNEHGAYLRKLTNIDSKFYDNPDNAVGIYINAKIARTQKGLLDNIFEQVVNKYIEPINNNVESFIELNFNDKNFKDWIRKLETTNSIDLEFQEGDQNTKTNIVMSGSELKNKLRMLPITMMKLAHYLKIANMSTLDDFKEYIDKCEQEGKDKYSLKINNEPIQWIKIFEAIPDHQDIAIDGDFKPSIPGVIPYNTENNSKIGQIDNRIRDMFNLMLHGVISTKKNNDFTRDFIRATAADFKYGIFSEGILCEHTSDEDSFADLSVTSRKLFSCNVGATAPMLFIDLFSTVEKSKTPVTKPVEQIVELTKWEKLHNSIQDNLLLNQIVINPKDYDNMEDYLYALNTEYTMALKQYIENDSIKNINDIVVSVNESGLSYLKDSLEFKGKKIIDTIYIGSTRQVLLDDGSKYNLNWNRNKLSITPVKEEKVISGENGQLPISGQIIDSINNIIEGIGFNSEVLEYYTDRINSIIDKTFNDNRVAQVSREDFDILINKIRSEIDSFTEDNLEDLIEIQNVNEENFKNIIYSIKDKLNDLQNSCFV